MKNDSHSMEVDVSALRGTLKAVPKTQRQYREILVE